MEMRPATVEDAKAIAALLEELGYRRAPAEVKDRLSVLSGKPDVEVILAVEGETIIGLIELQIRETLLSERRTDITDFVVSGEMRSRGIGAKMLGFAERWGKTRGSERLWVGTNVTRKRAHSFYERNGFALTKEHRLYEKSI